MEEKFEISHDDDGDESEYIDPTALVASIGIVRLLLSQSQCSRSICAALIEVHFIQTLCAIPKKIVVSTFFLMNCERLSSSNDAFPFLSSGTLIVKALLQP